MYNNATMQNESAICQYNNATNNPYQKNIMEFVRIAQSDISIPAGATYTFKIISYHNAGLGEQSVDWIPTFRLGSADYIKSDWAWWNSSWTNKRLITINGSIGENWTQEFSFAKPANMDSTCNDIRWTDSTESVEIPHRTVTCNTTTVIEHVRIDNNNTLYLYYNNNTFVNTTSNWRNSYQCGDNFNDNTYPNISTLYLGGGVLSVAGGELNATYSAGSNNVGWSCNNTINYQNYTFYLRGKSTQNGYRMIFKINSTFTGFYSMGTQITNKLGRQAWNPYNTGLEVNDDIASNAWSLNTYYNMTVTANGSDYNVNVSGIDNLSLSNTRFGNLQSSRIGAIASLDGTNKMSTDEYYVLPMQSLMPTYSLG